MDQTDQSLELGVHSDLDHVLSGQYRSRTGLGQGLLGTKKVADRFHVETGATGTRVEFELDL